MRRRIGLQVILGVAIVTAAVVGVMAVLIVGAQRRQLVFELTRGANQLSEAVLAGLHDDMLENRRESLHRQIVAIGRQDGIEKVRLFNKDGRIMFSSDAGEIGRSLDTKAEACYACHAEGRPLTKPPIQARARTFPSNGHRVLGIITPVPNSAGCSTAACHAHTAGQSVLGVLDVTVSMAEADAGIARSRARIAALAALAIAASSVLLWWLTRRLVLRPVQAVVAATRRVADGDLTATVPEGAKHELGELARAFNTMTRRLSETQRQLTQADKLASVGRLAAGVAHEINNPLTGVLTYASLLLDRPRTPGHPGAPPTGPGGAAAPGSPGVPGSATSAPTPWSEGERADLEVIVRETKRCRVIVKGLLDFARPVPPRPVPADINAVVRRAAEVAMKQLAMGRVDLAMDLETRLPLVSFDENQMQQVAVNLLLNAADAIGSAGGRVVVATRATAVEARGNAPIRRARCPRGCDLLDPGVRIGGYQAIRVLRSCRGRETTVHLDPIYGRFRHAAAEASEEGLVALYACSGCRRSLERECERCAICGAAVFAVDVPGEGHVAWCARIGCHGTSWTEREERGDEPVVELSVEDSGRGIAPEDLPRLFEPFFSTKGSRGTGLGLAVTWGIVEAHGGTIDVATRPGQGSRFAVRLPIGPKAAPLPAAALEPVTAEAL